MKNYTILMDISTEEISIIKNSELKKREEELIGDYYFIGDNAEDLSILNTEENYNIANSLLKEVGESIKYNYFELSILNKGIPGTGIEPFFQKKNNDILNRSE